MDELPELKPMIASFLRGSLETSKDKGKETSLEPPIVEFSQWVPWKAERCETPDWWTELSTVPGKDNHRMLAREVRASFRLPQWMWELGSREATLQAPPALPYLCRQKFMLPAQSIYAFRDIREIPWEKVVAYPRALQHWAEQNNLPAGGEPHLLAKSTLELREEVKWYLSFTDEEIFQGVALPEKEEEESPKTLSTADVPNTPCVLEPSPEERAPKFLGWEKVLHPSQPVVATGEIPQPTEVSRPKVGSHQLSWMIPIRPPASPPGTPTLPKPSLPSWLLVLVQPPTPPHGFSGVTAYLQMLQLVEVDPGSTHGCHALWASSDSWDFQYECQLYSKR